MNDYQNDIEKYLDGPMTEAERQQFEAQLAQDAALKDALDQEQRARALIREAGRLEIKDTLGEVERSLGSVEKESSSGDGFVMPLWMKRTLPIAAMLIIFLGVFQYTQSGGISSAEVYDSYFESYAPPGNVRDSNQGTYENWETASRLYSEKKYNEALPYFERAREEVPSYLAEFYRGVSHLSVKAPLYSRAIAAFDVVLASDNDYVQQARWYKALALLEIKDTESAFALLEQIVAERSYRHEEGAEILKLKIK